MRQIWITRIGEPEVLQVRKAPDPEAGHGELRIRVRAAGVNFADLLARMGLYPDAPRPPCVVGYEYSGIVDQVGAGVSRFSVGEHVFGTRKFGAYSDVLTSAATDVFKMPAAMSFEHGAALLVTYSTAHYMMMLSGPIRPGSTVLIHSAAGGIGLAAIDLALACGCIIIGTSSRSKHAFLRARGVQHPIAYGDYAHAVRQIVGERGVDLVLDSIGGSAWRENYALLGEAGRLVCFGASAAAAGKTRRLAALAGLLLKMPWWNPIKLMNDNKTISGVNMGRLFHRPDLLRPQFESLIAMYGRGELRPHVDRTFSFDSAAAAHHWLHDRKAVGKVLLVP
jgi:NADPH:quinone reductase-like Zn-dependent oxidoreductase